MRALQVTFPILHKLLIQLLPHTDSDSGEMQKLILKIFWSSTQFGISAYVQSEAVFSQWMSVFSHILSSPVPDPPQPLDAEQLKEWPHWKVRTFLLQRRPRDLPTAPFLLVRECAARAQRPSFASLHLSCEGSQVRKWTAHVMHRIFQK